MSPAPIIMAVWILPEASGWRPMASIAEPIARLKPMPEPMAGLSGPRIVSVSRHDPRKGLHVLLQALSRLRVTGVDFSACLVSGGVLLAAHRQLASRLDWMMSSPFRAGCRIRTHFSATPTSSSFPHSRRGAGQWR